MIERNDPPRQNEMKSFRLYVPQPAVPLAIGDETDYSPEELQSLREQFRPLAGRWRSFVRLQQRLIALWIGIVICLFFFRIQWLLPVAVVLYMAAFALGIFMEFSLKLCCPGCQNNLERELGDYCPECGHRGGMQSPGWLRGMKCDRCGMTLSYQKGRRAFKIRACTHCGLPLDEEGI